MKKIIAIILINVLIILIIVAGKLTYDAKSKKIDKSTLKIEKVTANKVINKVVTFENSRENQRKEKINLYGKNSKGIPVLMYHFFYDKSLGEKGIDNNFLEISKFEQHLDYLKKNDFYFPTFEELELYINGKIDLPNKSVILTVDDGNDTFFRLAIPIIEKYKIPVTSFVITNSCSYNIDDYKSDYVHFESHSNDMHKSGKNGKGLFVNLDYKTAYQDIQNSIKILDSNSAFCYPFGHYNEISKKVINDSDFKVAFTTKYGRVKVNSDRLALPRIRILRDDTLKDFIAKVS